jgi:hypothetical protein
MLQIRDFGAVHSLLVQTRCNTPRCTPIGAGFWRRATVNLNNELGVELNWREQAAFWRERGESPI